MPAIFPAFQAVRHAPFHGLPALHLALPGGASAVVALQGAQVLSWRPAGGAERLYLSPRARLDGHGAIRGGVPVCFPQFNQRGPLAKHGFARNLPWRVEHSGADDHGVRAVLALDDTPQTRAWWPHGFAARLAVELADAHLQVELTARNTGDTAWDFTAALHTYLQVDDVAQARLDGLDGCARWDSVADVHAVQQGPVGFGGEYDCVFSAPPGPLRLQAGDATIQIANSPSWTNTVVWNPGEALCATLPDMPADGWRRMLCVEAACVDTPVPLAPGAHWSGFQRLQLA
ncbi:D-hexose-6-phosphate mutarotase [Xylophilus sp. Leaf220]|uniref:D-hexose-6-phosphate mutarotase n=1 Tax=Xylophilus sp. Leaf220 TaxID=1735686 RepID=UPI0006FEF0F0|nr:D-hexose-6-phosphate mutarotase [Xylophilus sp. Leaf220]KQM71265.1 D-hexose-6-phosphate mutarotase [Xylophilus sp. Leaf220]